MIKILLTLACTLTFALADTQIIRWNLATTWNATTEPHSSVSKEMAKMVYDMTDGKFIINVDYSNKHRSPYGVFDMVKHGQYDMAHTISYYWKGKDLATLPLASMPFGMTKNQLHTWFKYRGGQELMDRVYAKHGLKSFLGGNTGKQMVWFKKEVTSIEDFKGLVIRMPSMGGEIVTKVGALATTIPAGELYTSLERGVVDALEWCSPYPDVKMGFDRLAKYYYIGWHEDSTELQYLVNDKKWNSLPKKYQEVLKYAMEASANNFYYKMFAGNVAAFNEIKKNHPDIQIKKFPKEVIVALKKANKELILEMANKNAEFKEVMSSQNKFLQSSQEWSDIENTQY